MYIQSFMFQNTAAGTRPSGGLWEHRNKSDIAFTTERSILFIYMLISQWTQLNTRRVSMRKRRDLGKCVAEKHTLISWMVSSQIHFDKLDGFHLFLPDPLPTCFHPALSPQEDGLYRLKQGLFIFWLLVRFHHQGSSRRMERWKGMMLSYLSA